ncbi:hypothetical protein D3C87_1896130 [compost metagenome]
MTAPLTTRAQMFVRGLLLAVMAGITSLRGFMQPLGESNDTDPFIEAYCPGAGVSRLGADPAGCAGPGGPGFRRLRRRGR